MKHQDPLLCISIPISSILFSQGSSVTSKDEERRASLGAILLAFVLMRLYNHTWHAHTFLCWMSLAQKVSKDRGRVLFFDLSKEVLDFYLSWIYITFVGGRSAFMLSVRIKIKFYFHTSVYWWLLLVFVLKVSFWMFANCCFEFLINLVCFELNEWISSCNYFGSIDLLKTEILLNLVNFAISLFLKGKQLRESKRI